MNEIKIGLGLDNIRFGITRNELKLILGEPDDIDHYSYTDTASDLTESWHYDTLELSASFDEADDWRLGALAVSSNDFTLNGKQLIGLKRDKFLKIVPELEMGEPEFDDFSEEDVDHKLICFESSSLDCWFDDEILSEIHWGPLWKDEETQIWPE